MLSSVLNSSLSGISAANLAINVTANNLANSLTDGFQSSRVVFADQRPQTLDHGFLPTGSTGSQNPTQVGRGVGVAAIDQDFSQGTLVLSGDPLDLALEGGGLPAPANSTRIVAGARELSNTNIAGELINLSLYSTMFRANLRVSEVGSEMLEELFNLGRF